MKRLHVHISVPQLADSIRFYTSLFGAEPSKEKSDYAKWELDDPRVNFAISTRSDRVGLDHLGIQVDSEAEVREINNRLELASEVAGEIDTGVCCYAESTKAWTVDKAGIAWENFMTMNDAAVYGADHFPAEKSSCCASDSITSSNSCC